MIAVAHFIAISCYIAAAATAALPFARAVKAPVRGVLALLSAGVFVHALALGGLVSQTGAASLTGLGPSLSFAGFVLAAMLLLVEVIAREVTLALAAAPLAALMTTAGNINGLHPFLSQGANPAAWLTMHIVLSFIGLAAYATAAAAGTMYLVARRELKSANFGPVLRFFPPLETLDLVNRISAIAGFLGLTLGVALAAAHSITNPGIVLPKLVWGILAWTGIGVVAMGRLLGDWPPRRAAAVTSITFVAVMLVYIVARSLTLKLGQFL